VELEVMNMTTLRTQVQDIRALALELGMEVAEFRELHSAIKAARRDIRKFPNEKRIKHADTDGSAEMQRNACRSDAPRVCVNNWRIEHADVDAGGVRSPRR
jgi:hypothetical protein